ncbi:hypothetical protein YTPLAS18_22490 [Nitrospira sp.]|nr:hypothetical protein YTPLAS18_22490 [Nitrospira sp.]
MPRPILVVTVFLCLVAVSQAHAVQMQRPQAEYSADSTIQSEEGTIQQRIYATPTKERKEMLTGSGDGAVMIFRYDTKVMWMLMPSEKMYMEHPIGGGREQRNDPSQWTYEDTVVGEETMDGIKVTKYKTIATSTDGKKYGGFSWRTKEGINLKQDLLYKEGNDKKRMLIELSNVKIGKQDAKLFEIPDEYIKFDMSGMMGGMMDNPGMGRPGIGPRAGRPDMEGMRPNAGRQSIGRPEVTPPPEDTPPAPESDAPSEEKSDMRKATDMLKGLFGH